MGEGVKHILETVPDNVQLEFVQTDASWSGETDEACASTKLGRDTASPLHKELRSVTGNHRIITTNEDTCEHLFWKEWQGAAQEECNNQSVNETEVRVDAESLVCELGASSSAGRCVRGEATAITRGRYTLNLEEILDQCKDAATLRQQLVNVVRERDAFILKAECCARISEAVEKQTHDLKLQLETSRSQNDAHKLELENVRSQNDAQEFELENVRTQKDVLKLKKANVRVQSGAQNLELENVRAENDALKLQLANIRAQNNAQKLELANLRVQYQEEVSLLKKDILFLRRKEKHLIVGQDALILRAQRTAEDLEATKKMRDSLKLELANLQAQYQEEVSLPKEDLRFLRTQRDHFIDGQDVLVLRAQRTAEDLEATTDMRDFFKLQLENLFYVYAD